MTKYRIVKYTSSQGSVFYTIESKKLFFWTMAFPMWYDSLEDAMFMLRWLKSPKKIQNRITEEIVYEEEV